MLVINLILLYVQFSNTIIKKKYKDLYMNSVKWYFPENLEEAYSLKTTNNSIFHSGGTAVRRLGLANYQGVIDTSKLPIAYFKKDKEVVLGAGLTFAEAVLMIEESSCHAFVSSALIQAANTPLRNRITIGGSLGAMHMWSDLIGPLLVLDSTVSIQKKQLETVEVQKYLTDRKFRENGLIENVSFSDDYDDFYYYREVRTKVDYPAFTVSIITKAKKVSIALTGSKNKFERLTALENELNNGKSIEDGLKKLEIGFQNKPHGTEEFLVNSVKVALTRGLRSVGL